MSCLNATFAVLCCFKIVWEKGISGVAYCRIRFENEHPIWFCHVVPQPDKLNLRLCGVGLSEPAPNRQRACVRALFLGKAGDKASDKRAKKCS